MKKEDRKEKAVGFLCKLRTANFLFPLNIFSFFFLLFSLSCNNPYMYRDLDDLYWEREANSFTVIFNSMGGSEVPEQRLRKGSNITRPEDPIREFHIFTAWYRDAAYTSPWDFDNDKVTADITLYAMWIIHEDPAVINISVDINGLIDEITAPADIVLSRTGNGSSQTAEVNITGVYDAGSINWRIRRVDAGNTDGYVTGNTAAIPLDAADIRYNSLGWHTVEINVTVNGLPYQTSFRFRIVE